MATFPIFCFAYFIGFFKWSDASSDKDIKWDLTYAALVEYANSHESLDIPKFFEAELSDGTTVKLLRWVQKQLLAKNEGKLKPDKLEKLQELVNSGKFSWEDALANNNRDVGLQHNNGVQRNQSVLHSQHLQFKQGNTSSLYLQQQLNSMDYQSRAASHYRMPAMSTISGHGSIISGSNILPNNDSIRGSRVPVHAIEGLAPQSSGMHSHHLLQHSQIQHLQHSQQFSGVPIQQGSHLLHQNVGAGNYNRNHSAHMITAQSNYLQNPSMMHNLRNIHQSHHNMHSQHLNDAQIDGDLNLLNPLPIYADAVYEQSSASSNAGRTTSSILSNSNNIDYQNLNPFEEEDFNSLIDQPYNESSEDNNNDVSTGQYQQRLEIVGLQPQSENGLHYQIIAQPETGVKRHLAVGRQLIQHNLLQQTLLHLGNDSEEPADRQSASLGQYYPRNNFHQSQIDNNLKAYSQYQSIVDQSFENRDAYQPAEE